MVDPIHFYFYVYMIRLLGPNILYPKSQGQTMMEVKVKVPTKQSQSMKAFVTVKVNLLVVNLVIRL